jgi:RNA polymerase sigma-70 factor, ECF subfamily
MLNPTPVTDALLIDRLVAGERAALGIIYGRHKDRIYRFALVFCASRDLAADVTQETFLQLALQPNHFDPASGALGAYLCGVARNVARRMTREEMRMDASDDIEAVADAQPIALADVESQSPLTRILKDEAAETVRLALRNLPAHYRETVILVELQDESYASAAAILQVPIGTVRSRLARGKALLADALQAPAPACRKSQA